MMNFLRRCWAERDAEFLVIWESSDLQYTYAGDRQKGEFIACGFLQVWWCAQWFTYLNPRGAVYYMLLDTAAVCTGQLVDWVGAAAPLALE